MAVRSLALVAVVERSMVLEININRYTPFSHRPALHSGEGRRPIYADNVYSTTTLPVYVQIYQ